jgi:PTH1 family peptidyl-tRNA hydrolase
MDYIVIGLGNPEKKYTLTRHNAGFLVLEHLAHLLDVKFNQKEDKLIYGNLKVGSKRIILAKPLTYMNLSGEAVKILLERYHTPLHRVIIIFDDVSLPFGYIRIRPKGSSGGHKGLKSIIALTGEEIPRLRMGIGSPLTKSEMIQYVLGRFSEEEQKLLPDVTLWAANAVITWIKEGTEKAMSVYNGFVPSLLKEQKKKE